jgi:hypothetical protein
VIESSEISDFEIFGFLKSRLQEIEKNEYEIKRLQDLIDNTEASMQPGVAKY